MATIRTKTKTMKNTILIILTLIMISCKKENNFEKQINWTNFYFKSDTIFGKYYEKLAIIIPVTLENDTTKYIMQFDTGTNMSGFYEIPFREIESISFKIDTFNINQYSIATRLFLDNYESQVTAFPIMKDYGNKNSKLIGSIGTNEFKNKILIIDYPNERLSILDSIPINYRNSFEFTDFEDTEGQVYLKLKIANFDYKFLFDTGSSLTPLVTSMPLYEKFTGQNKTEIDTITGNSWGITVISPGAKNIYPIEIGKIKLENKRVYGTNAQHTLDFFKSNEIDGLISNPYFFNDIIMIDFKDKLFGVKR